MEGKRNTLISIILIMTMIFTSTTISYAYSSEKECLSVDESFERIELGSIPGLDGDYVLERIVVGEYI